LLKKSIYVHERTFILAEAELDSSSGTTSTTTSNILITEDRADSGLVEDDNDKDSFDSDNDVLCSPGNGWHFFYTVDTQIRCAS